jgi:hypothetical protein
MAVHAMVGVMAIDLVRGSVAKGSRCGWAHAGARLMGVVKITPGDGGGNGTP